MIHAKYRVGWVGWLTHALSYASYPFAGPPPFEMSGVRKLGCRLRWREMIATVVCTQCRKIERIVGEVAGLRIGLNDILDWLGYETQGGRLIMWQLERFKERVAAVDNCCGRAFWSRFEQNENEEEVEMVSSTLLAVQCWIGSTWNIGSA